MDEQEDWKKSRKQVDGNTRRGKSRFLKSFKRLFVFSDENPIGDLNLSLIKFYKLSDIKGITHDNQTQETQVHDLQSLG